MKFVIDEVEVVHATKHCESVYMSATPYFPKAGVDTIEKMVAHLAVPDVSNGHQDASPLAPCDQCLLDLPVDA